LKTILRITYIECFYLKNTEYLTAYLSNYHINYGKVIEG